MYYEWMNEWMNDIYFLKLIKNHASTYHYVAYRVIVPFFYLPPFNYQQQPRDINIYTTILIV
jgi:hypothetical protein